MQELLPVLLLAALLGGIVQGVSGFAFSIIFMAMMQSFMPYTDLLSLASILCVGMLAVNAFLYRKDIVWRWIPLPLLINFIFTMGALRFLNDTMGFPYWHKLFGRGVYCVSHLFILLAAENSDSAHIGQYADFLRCRRYYGRFVWRGRSAGGAVLFGHCRQQRALSEYHPNVFSSLICFMILQAAVSTVWSLKRFFNMLLLV